MILVEKGRKNMVLYNFQKFWVSKISSFIYFLFFIIILKFDYNYSAITSSIDEVWQ